MLKLGTVILQQVEIVLKGVPEHFNEFPISFLFFAYIILIFVLNVAKRIFLWLEKRRGTPHQSCEYLVTVSTEQDCDHWSYRKYFKENGNSCEGCRGKKFQMTDLEAENRIINEVYWKRVVVLLANYGKNGLPYISFFYTLMIAIFEKHV